MAVFSLRLPHELERRLGEEARHCGQPRSELIREALEQLLRRREQERLVARLTAAAEVLASDVSARAESLDVALDFLPADSEALALAEEAGSQERTEQPRPQQWWR
ncbi:ribbon-helix-helix protein, CopG family [Synechococcus sp. BA-132 BA5]|uniref:ribbon-helix-helix protein, CopG family n=1 Tax=Synechococcus sp. BA-132 BA5 TaxID=3110252 RepID=UPI002B1EC5CB|nr:ribbon-helix-helix protein, CopG family [Synechococcus sp. BA-132 BA5]MEA5417100.1 ribbon-helix-helix protein, CopG family [Synechococcus sp. BA-132 BA5]